MQNILVSSASSIIGYGILRSLQTPEKKWRLIGTSIYLDSVAQAFCDVFEQAPLTKDPGYIGWLLDIIEKHKVDLIIPGQDADIYQWSESIAEIEGSGVKAVLNNHQLISLCKDKWAFYRSLNTAATPYLIDATLVSDFAVLADSYGLPFLLKPRFGYGSKGIVRVDNIETFSKHKNDIGSVLMAQPIVGNDDEEFTVSVFGDGAGGFYGSITLKRKLAKQGFTEKAEVAQIDQMMPALSTLCDYFKPIGPTNFQFRMHDGTLKLLEINPRISSSTSIRTGFGYNESKMAAEFYLENKKPDQPVIRAGRAIRYIKDLFFYEDRIDL